jgi:hypothetical protein
VQPRRVHVAAAEPVYEQVESEEQILGRRRTEAMCECYIATYRHAGSAQSHEHPQPIPAPGKSHTLEREGRERGLGRKGVPLLTLAASLDRGGAGGKRPLAGDEEAGTDDGVGVQHQDGVPLKGASMIEARLPSCGSARLFVRSAFDYAGTEGPGDPSGGVCAAVGDDQDDVAEAPVSRDGLETPPDDALLVVGRYKDQEPDSPVWPGRRLAVEERRRREQAELGGDGEAGKANGDRQESKHRRHPTTRATGAGWPAQTVGLAFSRYVRAREWT